MNPTIEWKKTQPGSTEAVQFSDGMLVTANDLTAAMHYPLSVIQVLLKAYFGCGIVCGLDLKDPAKDQPVEAAKPRINPATGELIPPPKRDPNFVLTVEKGVALGCDGYPIEICGPLKLDLTPDPCRLDRGAKEMFVAARRVTAAEAAARACGCASTGGEPAQQCTRMRDHALVQAFDEDHLPAEICRVVAEPVKANPAVPGTVPQVERPTVVAAICACLKQCGECGCRGEPWVLLGSVMVSEEEGLGRIETGGRRYVKPLACVCDNVERDPVQPAPRVEPDKDVPPAPSEDADEVAPEDTTAKPAPPK